MTWSLTDSQATLFSENAAWRDLWVTVKLPCSVRTQQNLQDANLSTDYRLQTVLTSTTRHLLKLTGSAVSTSAAADTADTHTHTLHHYVLCSCYISKVQMKFITSHNTADWPECHHQLTCPPSTYHSDLVQSSEHVCNQLMSIYIKLRPEMPHEHIVYSFQNIHKTRRAKTHCTNRWNHHSHGLNYSYQSNRCTNQNNTNTFK